MASKELLRRRYRNSLRVGIVQAPPQLNLDELAVSSVLQHLVHIVHVVLPLCSPSLVHENANFCILLQVAQLLGHRRANVSLLAG